MTILEKTHGYTNWEWWSIFSKSVEQSGSLPDSSTNKLFWQEAEKRASQRIKHELDASDLNM